MTLRAGLQKTIDTVCSHVRPEGLLKMTGFDVGMGGSSLHSSKDTTTN